MKVKKKALMERTMTRMDTESGRRHGPSWLSTVIYKLKQPFTRRYWAHLFERNDNETLVDPKLLSYSYLEAGLIETVSVCVLMNVSYYDNLTIFGSIGS
jgi:sodium/potassium-transporting ATPase subunit alpha